MLGEQQGLRPGSKRPRVRPRFVCSYKKQFHIFPPEEQSRHHNFHIYVENLYLRHSNSLECCPSEPLKDTGADGNDI